ncbi:MAG TPA: hypothetical protein VMU32_06875 [Solirubrobacteraceae bacterium]|nr:hypothetical protein [Solirubrobacteraceae bacterium]
MSPPGDAELLVAARRVLLAALQALAAHRDALVVIGAQAIYLHTGQADIALAETTKDSDPPARRIYAGRRPEHIALVERSTPDLTVAFMDSICRLASIA